jgi:hydrogenase maturation factor
LVAAAPGVFRGVDFHTGRGRRDVCMEMTGQVVLTGDGTAVVVCGKARINASLVILEMEGVPVGRGDWLVTHSGIAVRKATADEAARAAAQAREPGSRS